MGFELKISRSDWLRELKIRIKPKTSVHSVIAGGWCETMIPRDLIQKEIDDAHETAKNSARHELEYAQEHIETYKNAIAVFEQKSGVHISSYKAEDIGAAVKMVREGGDKLVKERLERMRESAERMGKFIDGEIESYQI